MNERIIEIDYTNHRGDRRVRKILPVGQLFFGSNQWHPTEQWMFNALDMECNETTKTFALSGINGVIGADRATELLTANNELLQRARDAEAQLSKRDAAIQEMGANAAKWAEIIGAVKNERDEALAREKAGLDEIGELKAVLAKAQSAIKASGKTSKTVGVNEAVALEESEAQPS